MIDICLHVNVLCLLGDGCLLDFPDRRLTPNRVRCADLNPSSNLTYMLTVNT